MLSDTVTVQSPALTSGTTSIVTAEGNTTPSATTAIGEWLS